MNATELLDNSHLMVIQALDNLNELQWDIPNVCGEWSVKEVVAHLTSYEHVLVDIFNTFLGHEPTPYIYKLIHNGAGFNDEEVEKRRYQVAYLVLDEYNDTQVEAVSLLAQIPAEKIVQAGTMPWYGPHYCLADIINIFYDHACEHCAQIRTFREKKNV